MKVERLFEMVLEKSKQTGSDLKISAIKVREDLRVAGKLTPEADANLEKADKFSYMLQNRPDISERFAREGFTNLSYEEWLKEFEKPQEEEE